MFTYTPRHPVPGRALPSHEALEPRRLFAGSGLTGQYFGDAAFSDLRATRVDPAINFDWSGGDTPAPSIAASPYSVQWSGSLQAPSTGRLTLTVKSNAAVRLYVNGKRIAGSAASSKVGSARGGMKVVAGQAYSLELDLVEKRGAAAVQLLWAAPRQSAQVIPAEDLYPAGAVATPPPGGGSLGTVPFAVPPMPDQWDAPLVITQGGTYTGNWQSLDPNSPAVTVRTSDPVVIENANVSGRGTLIATDVSDAHLTVRDTRGWALNPGVAGDIPGRFLDADMFDSVDAENNFMQGTSGIELAHYHGDNTPSDTVKVLRNLALNIDGRASDGNGGFSTKRYDNRQFCQLSDDLDLRGAEIAWNLVFNQPGNSRVEDNISVYQSRGTPDSHLLIHDNFIQGAYPADPTSPAYSGGGIMLGDGDANVEACAYVEAYANQVLDTTNYGIAIAAGHDNVFHDNRIVSTGTLPDGTPLRAQNVGAYVWKNNPGSFYNNSAEDNVIGWAKVGKHGNVTRNDTWFPDAAAGTSGSNVSLPGPITGQTEAGEYALWGQKLRSNGISVGPGIE